ncbi:MAG TPA: cupin domain-containing protein [Gaiellales bacterium]|nr:cupin domain-containing protein [Gaiellales bacterium]
MPVIERDAQRHHELHGARFHTLASPSLGSRETSVWRVHLEAGTPGLPHRVTREEIFVVVSGSATATLDGMAHPLSAGSTLVLPAGVELALETGAAALEAIVCLPVGGQGVVGDGEPFTPPWAE